MRKDKEGSKKAVENKLAAQLYFLLDSRYMKKYLIILLIILVALAAGVVMKLGKPREGQPVLAQNTPMITISSPAFKSGDLIPAKYTCDGSNKIPPLTFSGVSQSAKSLVVIVDDPDAPGGNFNHFVAWNIDPKTENIPEGNFPGDAVLGTNDAGNTGYFGPCPPSGTHRYNFKVYALDTTLNLDPSAKKADLEKAMEGHIVGQGEVMGKYSKQ